MVEAELSEVLEDQRD
jgi:uncharacterized protein (DUF1330 family)